MIEVLIIGILLFYLGFYAIICYIDYRIVRKIDSTISYKEMLIPFWNIYLIDKVALGKPYAIPYFWISLILSILLSTISKNYNQDTIIGTASSILIALTWATPIALIAQKLGKNVWIYFALMIVPTLMSVGVSITITIITLLILAFDSSKPTPPQDDETPNNITV